MSTSTAKRSPGRPLEFDSDKALDAAMRVFWEKGFDGTSLADLTDAMGIKRPSIYATFGNKETLFQKALERYALNNAKLYIDCLALDSAREGIDRLLREAVRIFTDPKNPGGCFGTQSVVTCSGVSAQLKRKLDLMRGDFETKLKKRFDRAVEAGELPAGTSTIDLARYYSVVFQGLGMQAKGGGSKLELMRVVDVAMERWPTTA